jgi:hypothetical protein
MITTSKCWIKVPLSMPAIVIKGRVVVMH